MHILRCMGSKFCVKFQRAPLKFHTKLWTHTPQNMYSTVLYFCVWVMISLNCDVISISETGPRSAWWPSCAICGWSANPPGGRLIEKCYKFNSLMPSDAIWRQGYWTSLAQVMACRLTAPIHYLKQCWLIVNCTLRNKLWWNFNQNSNIFVDENAIENVICDFPNKLSRRQCFNDLFNNRHWTITCTYHREVLNYWYCFQNTENDLKVSPVKQHVLT